MGDRPCDASPGQDPLLPDLLPGPREVRREGQEHGGADGRGGNSDGEEGPLRGEHLETGPREVRHGEPGQGAGETLRGSVQMADQPGRGDAGRGLEDALPGADGEGQEGDPHEEILLTDSAGDPFHYDIKVEDGGTLCLRIRRPGESALYHVDYVVKRGWDEVRRELLDYGYREDWIERTRIELHGSLEPHAWQEFK